MLFAVHRRRSIAPIPVLGDGRSIKTAPLKLCRTSKSDGPRFMLGFRKTSRLLLKASEARGHTEIIGQVVD